MLLILTGDIQIGKTRWLQHVVRVLEDAGVPCEGVLAPGIWKKTAENTFEKLGIDNEILPEHRIIPFARRIDLAIKEGVFESDSQAGKAGLKWHISDDAIQEVNNHFEKLIAQTSNDLSSEPTMQKVSSGHKRGVLFIDEFGRLELLRNEGLTSAMKHLSNGPQGRYEHAIVIARDIEDFPERVASLFGESWGGAIRISPNEECFKKWIEPLVGNEHK